MHLTLETMPLVLNYVKQFNNWSQDSGIICETKEENLLPSFLRGVRAAPYMTPLGITAARQVLGDNRKTLIQQVTQCFNLSFSPVQIGPGRKGKSQRLGD